MPQRFRIVIFFFYRTHSPRPHPDPTPTPPNTPRLARNRPKRTEPDRNGPEADRNGSNRIFFKLFGVGRGVCWDVGCGPGVARSDFLILVFFSQQKRPPEKFTSRNSHLPNFTFQNSTQKSEKKCTLHLCRAIWLKRGVFWKRCLFRKVHFLEILEKLESLENPQTGKLRRI